MFLHDLLVRIKTSKEIIITTKIKYNGVSIIPLAMPKLAIARKAPLKIIIAKP